MPKLDVSDRLVQELIADVAPLVADQTGWDLGLESLRARAIARGRGYEEILVGHMHQAGLQDWQAQVPDLIERVIEYLVESNVLAAYMPNAGEILVVRENVDDSNLEGLKLVLAHELVHRGQHLNHPQVFEEVDAAMRRAFALMNDPSRQAELAGLIEEVRQPMTLIESHATYLQRLLQSEHFPGAQVESHFNAAVLLMRLIGGGKIAQYTDALPRIQAAARAGGIDSLFKNG